MAKLVYYIATTLDGFIAGPGGEFDFFPLEPDLMAALNEQFPETVPGHFRDQAGVTGVPNRRFGTVVMGRATYEVGLTEGVTSPYPVLRQIVFSRTLPPSDEVEVVATDPAARVTDLKRTADRDIWLCGGAKLAGALYHQIDELIIKRYPVTAGAGLPLFSGTFAPARFEVTGRQAFPSGADILTCARAA
jgi:dihydrofolate reductase